MQILPTTTNKASTLTDQYLATFMQQDTGSTAFSDELARQQESTTYQENTTSYENNSRYYEEPIQPLTEAPYTLTSDNSVTYTADEVFFTQNELQDLERDLLNEGVPASSLTKLQELTENPQGATLGQVLAALQSPDSPPSLTEEETKTLEGLLLKLDPKGDLKNTILGHMGSGNGKAVLDTLITAMDNLPSNKTRIDLTKEEMGILAKASGMSEKATNQLLGSFGPYESLSLDKKDLGNILAPAFAELSEKAAAKEKLGAALDKTLGPILQGAKERMEDEKAAAELSTKRSEQSKVYIEKTVLEEVNNNLENTRAAQNAAGETAKNAQNIAQNAKQGETQGEAKEQTKSDAKADVKSDAKVDVKPDVKTDVKTDIKADTKVHEHKDLFAEVKVEVKSEVKTETRSDNKSDVKVDIKTETKSEIKQDAKLNANEAVSNNAQNKQHADDMSDDTPKDSKQDMGNLFQNADVRNAVQKGSITNTNIQTPVIGIGGLTAQNAVANAAQANQTNQQAYLSRQAASQLESAMLTAMKDGTKRIDLQLHPAELGSLTISLTSRNGEVNALIRSERSETTELIHKQLDQIRATLEEQGVKVDKLEVQTGTPENSSQHDQWDGMKEHNAKQEENARREALEQLKNLARMRNNSSSSDAHTLEHNMQNDMHNGLHAATNASQSVYIVT